MSFLTKALQEFKSLDSNGVGATPIKHSNQQLNILDSNADHIRIQAYAGSGKTFITREMAKKSAQKGRRNVYLAYNQAIAKSSQASFMGIATCATTHAVARQFLLQDPLWRSHSFKIGPVYVSHLRTILEKEFDIKGATGPIAYHLLKTLNSYFSSADLEISSHHLPELYFNSKSPSPVKESQQVDSKQLLTFAQKVWDLMSDPTQAAPMPHDGYLKLWANAGAPIDADQLFLDEAQDTNMALTAALSQKQYRCSAVGDKYQSIYTFRGAVDALSQLTDFELFQMSKTHRFGKGIGNIVNALLLMLGEETPIVDNGTSSEILSGASSSASTNRLIICRSNATVFKHALKLAKNNQPYKILSTNVKDLVVPSFLYQLHKRKPFIHETYGKLDTLDHFISVAKSLGDTHLIFTAELVQEYGDKLQEWSQLVRTQHEKFNHANVDAISTVHACKGLEAPFVQIADDFILPQIKKPQLSLIPDDLKEEAHVYYVALTRAQKTLHFLSKEEFTWAQNVLSLFNDPARSGAALNVQADVEKMLFKQISLTASMDLPVQTNQKEPPKRI